MYQRKYYPQEEIRIPENYGGYALTDEASKIEESVEERDASPSSGEETNQNREDRATVGAHPWEAEERVETTGHWIAPPRKREPLLEGATSILSRLGLHLPSLKLEDLLLLGVGVALLLSKERDVECGLLLLALTFF